MANELLSPYAGLTYPAGTASLQQFTFCAINGSGQLVAPSSGGFGVVLIDAPSVAASTYSGTDEEYSGGYTVGTPYSCIVGDSLVKVYFGATIAAGAQIMTNTSGQAVAASGGVILGVALEAHVSGDLGLIHYTGGAANHT